MAPRPEEAELLEKYVHGFDASPSTRLRKWIFLGFILACGAGTLLALMAGRLRLAESHARPRRADALGLRHPRRDRPTDINGRPGPAKRQRTGSTNEVRTNALLNNGGVILVSNLLALGMSDASVRTQVSAQGGLPITPPLSSRYLADSYH